MAGRAHLRDRAREVRLIERMEMTPSRLYWRCVRWGLATAALAGAVLGAYIGLASGDNIGERMGQAALLALIGVLVGIVLAVMPALIGSSIVIAFVRRRHPEPSSLATLERELNVVFSVALVSLNVAALVLLGSLDGWSEIGPEVPLVVLGDMCLILMYWWAKSSIRGDCAEAQRT